MIEHAVRVQDAGERLPREDQLAWKIAEMAADPVPLDPEAAKMAAMRIIDDWAVALAALNRPSVIAARGAALAHPSPGGSSIIGLGDAPRVDAFWGAYANATAIRELDFNDSFFAEDSSHPGDVIGPIAAVAEQRGLTGGALLRGIVTAYEVQVNLVKGIALNRHRIDHVAHLGPAVAAGIGAMLGLPVPVLYQAINLAAHLSISTRQTRKGEISSYKANAPGHIGQVAMLAVDRAMRGETSPAPVYEGDYGLIAILLDGRNGTYAVPLPEPSEPRRAILETYPKEHSAGYHGQALIDLAFRMRNSIGPQSSIRDIAIHTKELTHLVMGSGAGDPEKWDPAASRETLDHSAMYIFAIALQDGTWDHEASYAPARAARPDTVALWKKIHTVSDPHWTREFTKPAPLDKAHGARVVVTYTDASTLEDELRVANAHPMGAKPYGPADYCKKFSDLTTGIVAGTEADRFVSMVQDLPQAGADLPADLSISAALAPAQPVPGLFAKSGRPGD
ncbi:MAG: MmgE/PrpD family protein [Alphaproteobacteria bacterium]|nr:MmgE/PrpD family protein [Alphaproteobacteria bacterium]